MIQRITGREDAQQLSAGDLVELANLMALGSSSVPLRRAS